MTDDRAAFADIQSATILKPGDRVLLVIGDHWDRRQVDDAARLLSERFPDAEFTFMTGAHDVVVKPSEGSTDA